MASKIVRIWNCVKVTFLILFPGTMKTRDMWKVDFSFKISGWMVHYAGKRGFQGWVLQIALKVLQLVTTTEYMSKLTWCHTFEHIGIMSAYLRKERGLHCSTSCNILLILNSPLTENSNKLTGILSLWLCNFSSKKTLLIRGLGILVTLPT